MSKPAQPFPKKRELEAFKKTIWDYYRAHRRSFPWRETITPYRIVVSEVMLQQTQADRVVAKYLSFIKKFPNFKTLAQAPLSEVLKEWQGLGYNRRGKALKDLALIVTRDYKGILPQDPELLVQLPGIGKATAASITAFTFNTPVTFIETNVRTVYIHHFFNGKNNITDNDLWPYIEATVDPERSREWHYALMDYGVMLKKVHKNPSRQSAHYNKQSRFEGSLRQLRGAILRILHSKKTVSAEEIKSTTKRTLNDIKKALTALEKDSLIRVIKTRAGLRYTITN